MIIICFIKKTNYTCPTRPLQLGSEPFLLEVTVVEPNRSTEETMPGDIIDFAVLAALTEKDLESDQIVAIIRELTRPWLHPTGDVIQSRLSCHSLQGRIELSMDGDYRLTTAGRSALRFFVVHGVARCPAGFRELAESLRVVLADQLPVDDRQQLFAELMDAQDENIGEQIRRRNLRTHSTNVVARLAEHAIVLADSKKTLLQSLIASPDDQMVKT